MEDKFIELAKKGNKIALERLLQDNYSIVKGYLLKMTLDESLADDITQETMLKAILNIKKYEPKAKFSTWLITIATNIFRDHLRKNKPVTYDDALNSISLKSLEDDIIDKIELDRLKKVLAEIPETKRMVFILKHYYGYSYNEISEIMKCPIGTVRSRLHYCIERLKSQMKGVR